MVFVNAELEIVTTPTVFHLKIRARPHVRRVSLGLLGYNANHVLLLVTIVLRGLLYRKQVLRVRLGNGPVRLALRVHTIVQSVLQDDSQRKLP